MKSFSTLGAFAALLVNASAGFLSPEEIDRNVAEARSQRQAQCGRLPRGSAEYNQCMAHWTNRVVDSYPDDQHLIPRQEAERVYEMGHADAYRDEADRLVVPETEHYIAGSNSKQRVAVSNRHVGSEGRVEPINAERGPAAVVEAPMRHNQQLPEQNQLPVLHNQQLPEQNQLPVLHNQQLPEQNQLPVSHNQQLPEQNQQLPEQHN
ncbi:hypothetical protein IWW50_002859 [Coemansia erecta]|nr:hypothetical protein IWW50_002859 [Coemansia erecta]